jgi:hypothetical protein
MQNQWHGTYLLRKALRPFANGVGGLMSHQMKIHPQGRSGFPPSKILPTLSCCPLDLAS